MISKIGVGRSIDTRAKLGAKSWNGTSPAGRRMGGRAGSAASIGWANTSRSRTTNQTGGEDHERTIHATYDDAADREHGTRELRDSLEAELRREPAKETRR